VEGCNSTPEWYQVLQWLVSNNGTEIYGHCFCGFYKISMLGLSV
jgi:hypothetical protein